MVLFTRVWDSHSGMDALCRLFPIRRDWKAELKKPSPGPLVRDENHDYASNAVIVITHYSMSGAVIRLSPSIKLTFCSKQQNGLQIL